MALTLNDFKPFIDWMQENPGLSAFAVFIISCAESLAIVGLFIPGTIVMPAIGSMIGAGVLPAHWIILAAILGAVLGDNLSYWLGYHFHSRIAALWPFNHFPKLLAKGEEFFNRYGGLSVFIGRFVGPVRPIIPVVAGMLAMKPVRFFVANVASAIAWAILYMAPGILLGAISEQLAPHVGARLLVILALISFTCWLLVWVLNKLWNHAYKMIEKSSRHFWKVMSVRFPWTQKIAHYNPAFSERPFAILLYILFFFILLVSLTISVLCHGWISYFDWPLFLFLRSIQIPPLDNLMAVAYTLTNPIALGACVFSLFAWFLFQKRWRMAYYWLLNVAVTFVLAGLLQRFLTVRPPDIHSALMGVHAYPDIWLSVFCAVIGNFLMFSYYRRIWLRYKKYLLLLMLSLFALAAVPQMYFGFYWFSGCLASLGCGALCTWCCLLFFHRQPMVLDMRPMLFLASMAAMISVTALSLTQLDSFLAQMAKPQFSLHFPLASWQQGQILPVPALRENFLGMSTEPLVVQYAGDLEALKRKLEKQGWETAPNPSFVVLLNRIGAKDRAGQLPLFPDLYRAQKPALIMMMRTENSSQMLVLRLWSSQLLLMPGEIPLWLGTVKYHRPWHWKKTLLVPAETQASSPVMALAPFLPTKEITWFGPILHVIGPSPKKDEDG